MTSIYGNCIEDDAVPINLQKNICFSFIIGYTNISLIVTCTAVVNLA